MALKLGKRAPCVNQSLLLLILHGAACIGSWGGEPAPNFLVPRELLLTAWCSLAGFLGLQSAQPKEWG